MKVRNTIRNITIIGGILAVITLVEGGGLCCWRVQVQRGSDTKRAYQVWPGIYKTYTLTGHRNGYVYYVSEDGKNTIHRGVRGSWFVSKMSKLGENWGYV